MDNIFTVYKYDIYFKEWGKPIYLVPFGDMHRYAPLCHEHKWLEFLDWAKNKRDCYFLGMGDYDDLASYSERAILGSRELHESTRQSLDDMYEERVQDLCSEIGFMEGKLVGLLEGNHHAIFTNDATSTTQRMCQRLKCKFLGTSAFIMLVFHYTKGNRHAKLNIWCHHGRGASRTAGGSVNTVEQMTKSGDADIYLMGHDHRKSIAMQSRLYLTHGNKSLRLVNKKIVLGRTGSFLKGYEPDTPSYVVRSALPPTDLGVIKLELTPKNISKFTDGVEQEHFYIDIHGSL